MKDLVKRVKSALREQLCNGDVDSTEEQAFVSRVLLIMFMWLSSCVDIASR